MAFIDLKNALEPVPAASCRYDGVAILGGNGAAFGGHCAAQSLSAAASEAGPDRPAISVHTTFLSRVAPDEGVSYEVSWLKKGRAFSILRVDASQGGLVRLTSVISFHDSEVAPQHQISMPVADPPHACANSQFIPPGTNPEVRRCFEIRSVEIAALNAQQHPTLAYWLRCRQPLGSLQHLHAGALVWFSDLSMPFTADLPYTEKDGRRFGASLDHSVWIHRQFSAEEWLLLVQESPIYAGARALTRGMFFTANGDLVATAAQETLIRRVRDCNTRSDGT